MSEKEYVIDNLRLMSEWDWEKNIDFDPNKVTIGSDKKVWWIGKCGHSWDATVSERNRGYGCPICAGKRIIAGVNDLASNHPEIMSYWDYEKNDLLGILPNQITSNYSKKVWWKCEKGHSWQRSPYKNIKSDGCPYCLNRRILVGYNDLSTLFPNLAEEWDFSKNQVDINSILPGSHQKIYWICSKCKNKWIATLSKRTSRGNGCPECAKAIRAKNRIATCVAKNGSITDPLLLKEWDFEKNEQLGLFPNELTPFSNKKAWWKCSTCSYEWETTIANRGTGFGCPVCGNKIVVEGINDLATTHPQLAAEWDFEENGDFLPQNATYGMGKKVGWICPLGHKYKATILHRSSGTNCPICNSGRQTSFAEQAVFYYIKKLYPNAVNRYKDIFDNGMEIDIFIPDIRYGIEYDGSFWHKEDGEEREKIKYDICKSNGIRLIRIKAYQKEYSIEKSYFADYTLFLKEDSISELEKLIQTLYFRLSSTIINPIMVWEDTINTIDIEKDRYDILRFLSEKKDSFADEHPELALEWHPTKNQDLKPNMFKSGSSFSAWWLCSKCDYEWKTTIYARSKGIGCKKCSVKNRSGANNSGARKIYQYTKDGVFVKEWGAIIEAARSENINPSNMAMCANGQRAVAGGYRWSFEYFEKLPPIQKNYKSRKGQNGKQVIQIDLQGNVVNHFVSLYEAEEKTGINATSISKVINGHVKMAGGYVWKVEKHE